MKLVHLVNKKTNYVCRTDQNRYFAMAEQANVFSNPFPGSGF